MGEIISFKKDFNIEKVFKALEENNIDIKTIYIIVVVMNEPLVIKNGKLISGGTPYLTFKNPSKEDILNRLQEYLERLEGLVISCSNPKVNLEFNRFSILLKTTDMS